MASFAVACGNGVIDKRNLVLVWSDPKGAVAVKGSCTDSGSSQLALDDGVPAGERMEHKRARVGGESAGKNETEKVRTRTYTRAQAHNMYRYIHISIHIHMHTHR